MNYPTESESAQRRAERDRMLTMLYCDIYDTIVKKKVHNPRRVAIDIALATGAPPYHVGFDRAYIVVPKLLNNEALRFRSDACRLFWLDMTAKVRCVISRGKVSIARAVALVLDQCRASRFFISDEQAWVIIKRELKAMHCRKSYGRALE